MLKKGNTRWESGRSKEKGFREALLTQHPLLYLLYMLKMPFKKYSLRI